MCLDDFGANHASLVHLKQFPIDCVKIDESFLRLSETSPTDGAVVSAIIATSESIGVLPIGEGVETPGQMSFLRDRGCATMQGFLLGQPLGAHEAGELLRATVLPSGMAYLA